MRITRSIGIGSLLLFSCIPCFFPSSAYSQKPRVRPVVRITIVDSKDATIGVLLGGLGLNFAPVGHNIAFTPTVLLDVEGRLVPVGVAKEGFRSDTILYYESTGCAGQPWVADISLAPEVPLHGLLPSVGIGPPGHTVYAAVAGSTPQLRSVRSAFAGGHCYANAIPQQVVPTEALIDLDTEFTPPFQVKAAQ